MYVSTKSPKHTKLKEVPDHTDTTLNYPTNLQLENHGKLGFPSDNRVDQSLHTKRSQRDKAGHTPRKLT